MLATFVVTGYKHEQYIREAIEGAFSQTYSPLEIILSDDCSTDATFEIMRVMARDYHGPHTVRLNRNEQNLGVARHVNKSFRMMRGELWIGAAGDDISLPHRTAQLVQAITENEEWMAVSSSVELFGDQTGVCPTAFRNRKLHPLELCIAPPPPRGCAAAYRRCVFETFGELESGCIAEDMALSFRAGLLGISGSIPDVLVKYRISASSLSLGGSSREDYVRKQKIRISGFRQNLRDFDRMYPREDALGAICRALLALQVKMQEDLLSENTMRFHLANAYLAAWKGVAKLIALLHFSDWLKRKRQLGHL